MNIRCFCCMGDSITSDQVSGIGTMVAHRLNAQEVLNAACGYATCSDWHEGDRNITPVTLIEPPNTNTADNVLSNQVRRVLQALTPKGSIIRWTVCDSGGNRCRHRHAEHAGRHLHRHLHQ